MVLPNKAINSLGVLKMIGIAEKQAGLKYKNDH